MRARFVGQSRRVDVLVQLPEGMSREGLTDKKKGSIAVSKRYKNQATRNTKSAKKTQKSTRTKAIQSR